jgi:hypothetical protein
MLYDGDLVCTSRQALEGKVTRRIACGSEGLTLLGKLDD